MGWQLASYLAASRAVPLLAPLILRRRLARGKEDPSRWREKLGEPGLPRPAGRLIWLHAVGLGEVLALRGLIAALAAQDAELQFLVTSSARSSAQVMAGQLPPRTCHQFLPLDAPPYLQRFLAHWRPALSIWAEQDLWPGAVVASDAAGVPLALVNARMSNAARDRRARARGLYADLLARFALIAAQDQTSADNLRALGAGAVQVTGPLKAAAPPLAVDPAGLRAAKSAVAGRLPWLLASSHPEDEAAALAAQIRLFAQDRRRLLIVAPRDPARGVELAAACAAQGLPAVRRALGRGPEGAAVWIADTFGEMGIWYRLSSATLVGGTFGPTEGHNPWEPAALGSAVLHGPRVANFAADFALLDGAGAALEVTPGALAHAAETDHSAMAGHAAALSRAAQRSLGPLARALLGLMG
ncbi:MAG: 3-deoxy-D-manno-octulosonic acid transferase [Rhodobacteraceae bacterium]|jgi:3-deoxy-D-manno-octulosonic-acid transferase|nr:3-deoxy-D-manno-octulosonic acid transferase [Paracoccaceae bacterium]